MGLHPITGCFVGVILLCLFVLILYTCVPTTNTNLQHFWPNVFWLQLDGEIRPVAGDNSSLDTTYESSRYSGVYQYNIRYHHTSLELIVPWKDRHQVEVWECAIACGGYHEKAEPVLLYDHRVKHWRVLEMNPTPNSPVQIARTKRRKKPHWRNTPFVEMAFEDPKATDGYILSTWDFFLFDTPVKWGTTAAVIISTTLFVRRMLRDDDDD